MAQYAVKRYSAGHNNFQGIAGDYQDRAGHFQNLVCAQAGHPQAPGASTAYPYHPSYRMASQGRGSQEANSDALSGRTSINSKWFETHHCCPLNGVKSLCLMHSLSMCSIHIRIYLTPCPPHSTELLVQNTYPHISTRSSTSFLPSFPPLPQFQFQTPTPKH